MFRQLICFWFVCLIYLFRQILGQPGRINEVNGRHILDVLLEAGVGASFFQDYVNDQARVQAERLSSRDLQEELIDRLREKLADRVLTVKSIIEFVINNRLEFLSNFTYTHCCDVELSPQQYDSLYKTEVDTDAMCYSDVPQKRCKTKSRKKEAESSGNLHLFPPPQLLNRFIVNYKAVDGIRHQYFGTENGLVFKHPSSKNCRLYDHRTESWYRSAVNKNPKAFTILFDSSFEMGKVDFEGTTMHEGAKETVRAVMRSINSRDTVYIIPLTDAPAFKPSTEVYDECFLGGFSYVSDKLRHDVNTFLKLLMPNGTSTLSDHLDDAFDSLENYPYDSERSSEKVKDPVIIYITGVLPDDDLDFAIENLFNKSKEYNDPVLIIYQVGQDPEVEGTLKRLQLAYSGKSEFQQIPTLDSLYTIPKIHQHFPPNSKKQMKFSYPSKDETSGEAVITVSAPIMFGDELFGAAAVDIAVYDLLSEFVSFKTKSNYAFVFDISDFLMLFHPLAPLPSEIQGEPPLVYLSLVEWEVPNIAFARFFGPGLKVDHPLPTGSSTSRGDPHIDGVNKRLSEPLFLCNPLIEENLELVICCVFGDIPFEFIPLEVKRMSVDLTKNQIKFMYHRYDLKPAKEETKEEGSEAGDDASPDRGKNEKAEEPPCRAFYRKTYKSHSSVKFSPKSFLAPAAYKFKSETVDDVTHYSKIVKGEARNDLFIAGVVEDVKLTSILDMEWNTGELEYSTVTHTVWRYIGTNTGVLRIQPAMYAPKLFDPTQRTWYLKAVSKPGTRILIGPQKDAFGAGFICTAAVAIFQKNSDDIFGVVGIDITLQYLQFLVETNFYLECSVAGFICFLMDDSGYVLTHPSWVHTNITSEINLEKVHIIDIEPHIAYHMIRKGYMKRDRCTDIYYSKDRTYYKVELPSSVITHEENGLVYFKIVHAAGTNMYAVQKRLDDPESNATDICQCRGVDNFCQLDFNDCECPCAIDAPYDVCDLTVRLFGTAYKPCTPKYVEPFDGVDPLEVDSSYTDIYGLDFCIPRECIKQLNLGECHSVSHCRWCTHDYFGVELKQGYCDNFDACWFGQVGRSTLYPGAVKKQKKDWTMLIMIASGIGGGFLLQLAIFIAYKRKQARKRRAREEAAMIMTEDEDAEALRARTKRRRGAISIRRTNSNDELDDEEEDEPDVRKYLKTQRPTKHNIQTLLNLGLYRRKSSPHGFNPQKKRSTVHFKGLSLFKLRNMRNSNVGLQKRESQVTERGSTDSDDGRETRLGSLQIKDSKARKRSSEWSDGRQRSDDSLQSEEERVKRVKHKKEHRHRSEDSKHRRKSGKRHSTKSHKSRRSDSHKKEDTQDNQTDENPPVESPGDPYEDVRNLFQLSPQDKDSFSSITSVEENNRHVSIVSAKKKKKKKKKRKDTSPDIENSLEV